MAPSVADRLSQIPRKPLAARLRSAARSARETAPASSDSHPRDHADRKSLAEIDEEYHRRLVGKVVARALVLANITAKEVTHDLQFRSQSTVSRWMSGTDRPHFDRLLMLDKVRPWLPIAWGEVCGAEAEHVVRVRTPHVGG